MGETKQDGIKPAQEGGINSLVNRLAIAAFVLASLILIALFRPPTAPVQSSIPYSTTEKNHADYQRVLGEMHTGLRLARLTDFLEHTPGSTDIKSARIQQSVLQMHEQRAWAVLSETIYSLEANVEDKTSAREHYITYWSKLIRPQQLSTLAITPPIQLVTDETGQDAETDRVKTTSLAGGPKKKKRRARTQKKRIKKNTKARTVKARIKKVRKPVYPSRAQNRGIEAVVMLSLTIDTHGRVTRVRTLEVNAERYRSDFIRAAKRAARRTRFHPKTIGDKPVETTGFKRRYRFSLED